MTSRQSEIRRVVPHPPLCFVAPPDETTAWLAVPEDGLCAV